MPGRKTRPNDDYVPGLKTRATTITCRVYRPGYDDYARATVKRATADVRPMQAGSSDPASVYEPLFRVAFSLSRKLTPFVIHGAAGSPFR